MARAHQKGSCPPRAAISIAGRVETQTERATLTKWYCRKAGAQASALKGVSAASTARSVASPAALLVCLRTVSSGTARTADCWDYNSHDIWNAALLAAWMYLRRAPRTRA